MRFLTKWLSIGLFAIAFTAGAAAPPPPAYSEALELIHAYGGSGNELEKAMQLAEGLSKSAPKSGYAQVLYAEALSTWRLNQQGQPTAVRDQVLAMADEALKLNPTLAQAHASKARALVRSSQYDRAKSSIDAALKIDPTLSSAIFLRADVFRRTSALSEAEAGYRKFIESTPVPSRKANGYGWIAHMYQDAAYDQPANRGLYIPKARAAFETSLDLSTEGAWKIVNFAIFLNDLAGDFEAAERYAHKALNIMEFPMARYHWAAARYQRLGANAPNLQGPQLAQAVEIIAKSTRVSLKDALAFSSFSGAMLARMKELQSRLPPEQR